MNGIARTQSEAHTVTDVAQYAAQVREHLVGMTAEQIDDLTDGLEADLAAALADAPSGEAPPGAGPNIDLVERFGDPAEYACELRVAAGLPEPVPTRRPRAYRRLAPAVSRLRRRVLAWLGRQPWWSPLRDFLLSVRPIWWLARGWVAFQVVLAFFGGSGGWVPTGPGQLVLLVVLVVVSVQWGRGRWLPRRVRWLPVVGTVAAVLLMLPMVATAYIHSYRYRTNVQYVYSDDSATSQVPDDGVWVGGIQVSNLFVYDADGNPLDNVQIYDDRGRAVRTTTDDGWGSWNLPGVTTPWTFVAAQDEDGRRRWNVYPLLGAPTDDFDFDGGSEAGDGSTPILLTGEERTPPRPFAKAPALVEGGAEAKTATGEAAEDAQSPTPDPAGSATAAGAETPASDAETTP